MKNKAGDAFRIEEIQYLRGFAILAVIAIHTVANFTKIPDINALVITALFIDLFLHFAVPLFIFISGFVLMLNYTGVIDRKAFYKKRFFSVIPQYIFFSILYIFLFGMMSHWPTFLEVLYKVALGGGATHLWYIPVIVQFYLFFPEIASLYHAFEKIGKIKLLLISLLILQICWNSLILLLSTMLSGPLMTIMSRIFFSHILYFVFGMYLGALCRYKSWPRLKRMHYVIFLLISLTLNVAITLYCLEGMSIYGSFIKIQSSYFFPLRIIEPILFISVFIFLFGISYSLKSKPGFFTKLLDGFGNYSYGIYLIHVVFLLFAAYILRSLGILPTSWFFYPITFSMTAIFSICSIYLISLLPNSYLLVGKPSPNLQQEKFLEKYGLKSIFENMSKRV